MIQSLPSESKQTASNHLTTDNQEGRRLSEHLKPHVRRRGQDSDNKGQRAAIGAYAKAAGYEIVDTFYEAAV
jgi:hypothetical protein